MGGGCGRGYGEVGVRPGEMELCGGVRMGSSCIAWIGGAKSGRAMSCFGLQCMAIHASVGIARHTALGAGCGRLRGCMCGAVVWCEGLPVRDNPAACVVRRAACGG